MFELDGSFGEGGGQILRTSVALAAVLQKGVRIFNIRSGRSEPGLQAQHLTGVKAVASLCSASCKGLEMGSTELVFEPGPIKHGTFRFEVGTAGSVTLVLQAVMPLLPFASGNTQLEIVGGTDVKWSPPVDYLRLVALPLLSRMGVAVSLNLVKRGHYPKGGGMIRISSSPSDSLRPFLGVSDSKLERIVGRSHATGLPRHVAERQAATASRIFQEKGFPQPEIDVETSEQGPGQSPGSGIVLCAMRQDSALLGGDFLGEKSLPAEKVGETAAQVLLEQITSRSFLDMHMGDMIVPYLALANGQSEVTVSQITKHTVTNVWDAEQLTGVKFDSLNLGEKPGRLRVTGLGLRRNFGSYSPIEPDRISNS